MHQYYHTPEAQHKLEGGRAGEVAFAQTFMSIETRVHPRIDVNWHTFIKTVQGSIAATTRDISVDGAFIFSPVKPELGQRFTIYLKPSGVRSIPVIAKMVWSGNLDIDDETVFGMGIRFIAIAPEHQHYIASLVEAEVDD